MLGVSEELQRSQRVRNRARWGKLTRDEVRMGQGGSGADHGASQTMAQPWLLL